MNPVYGLALHDFSAVQVDKALAQCLGGHRLNPVRDSDFFFVPCSRHADHFIFVFVSPSLKFTIFILSKVIFIYDGQYINFHQVSTPQILIGPSAG